MRAWLLVLGVTALACSSSSEGGGDAAQTGGTGGEDVACFQDCSSGGDQGSGGAETGGASTGGAASGGASTGGKASGGSATGGKSSGGSDTGGQGTGGQGLPDTDGDGVPDASDQCPGGDDNQDLNDNDQIDECEPGWCRDESDPTHELCSMEYGVRQGYCTMEDYSASIGPGECVTCSSKYYDCNDDWEDGCETYSAGAHPCVP